RGTPTGRMPARSSSHPSCFLRGTCRHMASCCAGTRADVARVRSEIMLCVLLYRSPLSDWNHGNAHCLRGVVSQLQGLGHQVAVLEPADGWSRQNLLAEQGFAPGIEFARRFPHLRSTLYDPATLDLDQTLDGADLVLVHEWNE